MSQLINRYSEGVFIISATPFTENGELYLSSTDSVVDFYLNSGVSGMTILGIMGEAQKLTAAESLKLANHIISRVGGRIPIVVGVSGASLDNMKRLSQSVMDAGASGVMVAPMPGLCTETKLDQYYKQVCHALGPEVPICLQDYPQTTGVQFSVETILKLTRENEQIVMLKHEDWPGLTKLSRVRTESDTNSTPRM